MNNGKRSVAQPGRNLMVLFWALNGLDAVLTLLGLSRGATELNPLWASFPAFYSMGFKLVLAGLAGLWFYLKGWWVVLLAGSIWLVVVVVVNLITLTYLL